MNILSIQSSVVFGHVGNAAAVFPLQRLGHEVWPIHTVQFSNHTGYPEWSGQVFGAAHVAELVDGIARRGALAACDAVLSGYLGDAAVGDAVLGAVARARAANPRLLYCCDPVIGDVHRGVFVRPEIPAFFGERALAAADLATPNVFELGLLTGLPVESLVEIRTAARALQARGPRVVAVTSLLAPAVAAGRLGVLLVSPEGERLVETPLLDFARPLSGTGDLFAALLLGHWLAGAGPAAALDAAVNGVFAVLAAAAAAGVGELPLVAEQERLVRPPLVYRSAEMN